MATSFKFLSVAEFDELGAQDKLAYLSDAMGELQRSGRAGGVHGWDNLFAQPVTQQQQQEQPQPTPDPPKTET